MRVYCTCRHRHIGGPGIGVSLILIGQTWLSGVPRPLRTNSTHYAIFRTHNVQDRKVIYNDICSDLCTYTQFEQTLDSFTAARFGYLFVDRITRQMKPSY